MQQSAANIAASAAPKPPVAEPRTPSDLSRGASVGSGSACEAVVTCYRSNCRSNCLPTHIHTHNWDSRSSNVRCPSFPPR